MAMGGVQHGPLRGPLGARRCYPVSGPGLQRLHCVRAPSCFLTLVPFALALWWSWLHCVVEAEQCSTVAVAAVMLLTSDQLPTSERRNEALTIRTQSVDAHRWYSGTSQAAPLVSGIVAQYLERNPTANWEVVKQYLAETATQHALVWPRASTTLNFGQVRAYHFSYAGGKPNQDR